MKTIMYICKLKGKEGKMKIMNKKISMISIYNSETKKYDYQLIILKIHPYIYNTV